MSDYETVLEALEHTPRFLGTTDLNKTAEFYHKLGSPAGDIPTIHVAGTNGKGSVCNYLTRILMEAGLRVGTCISPHLSDIRERMVINGQMMDKETFASTYDLICDRAKGVIALNHSEILFLMAMTYFDRVRPDVIVLETGLGGRLDVTNIVASPRVCVITRIGLDHMQYLGDTKAKIAGEKAGIIKKQVPVVFLDQPEGVGDVIRKVAQDMNAPIHPLSGDQIREVIYSPEALQVKLKTTCYGELSVSLKQPALYQAENALLAAEAAGCLRDLHVTKEAVLRGLLGARWPGRMEEFLPHVYIDGGHNEDGIRSFLDTVRIQREQIFEGKKLLLIFAAASDKDYAGMIRQISKEGFFARVLTTSFPGERSTDPEILADLFRKEGMEDTLVIRDHREAVRMAVKMQDDFAGIYFAGSLYLAAAVREILQQYL